MTTPSTHAIRAVLLVLSLLPVAPALADLPLGSVEVVTGPGACGGQQCWELEVSCPRLEESAFVTLKVGAPRGDDYEGTILFASGGGGRGLWERFGVHARRTLRRLRNEGYRTVQLAWQDPWLNGVEGGVEGQADLACRPATVARWVADELHGNDPDAAICATGNSGGAAQVSYMLSHYGLAEELASVVPTGGPPMGRIDLGCLLGEEDSPELATLIYGDSARRVIDRGLGFYDEDGPCLLRDDSFASEFEEASISTLDPGDYLYPSTMVWFVFGELDDSSAVGQGITFFDRLVEAGSPLVELTIADRTPHATPSTRQGARAIRQALLESCRPWD